MASRPAVQLVGRSSSHFTRVAAIFAYELGVPFELLVVSDLTSLDAAAYGGHPALKVPALRVGASVVFGAENIARRLAEIAGRGSDPRVVWPERLTADAARNAQELTWLAMSAQVQLILGAGLGRLPSDSALLVKTRTGLHGALAWLDAHLSEALAAMPPDRDVSLLEVTLFCLVEHLDFRRTLPTDGYANLRRFAAEFATRPSALRTAYRYDAARPQP
ncbi:MAG: glutathione S-transferase family protein [Myxococcaceae bacterium]|nr:MAG: glutathione S-transferase family protein [Myxococcaceae bacterium]